MLLTLIDMFKDYVETSHLAQHDFGIPIPQRRRIPGMRENILLHLLVNIVGRHSCLED